MTTEPVVLTMAATAKILQIGRRQVYALAASGGLPGVLRIGTRTLRVSRAVLMNWINAGADGHGEPPAHDGHAHLHEEESPPCT